MKKNFLSDLFINEDNLQLTKIYGEVQGFNKSIETKFNLETGGTYVSSESVYEGNEHQVKTHVSTSPTLVNSHNVPVVDFFLQIPNRGEIDVTLHQDVRMRNGHYVSLYSIVHQNRQFLTKIINHDTRKYYLLYNDAVLREIAMYYTNFKKIGALSVGLPAILLFTGKMVAAGVLFVATFFIIKRVILEKNITAIAKKIEYTE